MVVMLMHALLSLRASVMQSFLVLPPPGEISDDMLGPFRLRSGLLGNQTFLSMATYRFCSSSNAGSLRVIQHLIIGGLNGMNQLIQLWIECFGVTVL